MGCYVAGPDSTLELALGVPPCSWCSGTGRQEGVTTSGDLLEVDCEDCQGSGLDLSVSGCELCGAVQFLNNGGICQRCHERGEIELEVSRSRYESAEAEELAWAVAIGWITAEEAAA